MAVHPQFWRMVGLEENEGLPLSFRANGAWVLRGPFEEAQIGSGERDPTKLAAATDWANDPLSAVRSSSPEMLLTQIERLGDRRKRVGALEVCLRFLVGDTDGAMARQWLEVKRAAASKAVTRGSISRPANGFRPAPDEPTTSAEPHRPGTSLLLALGLWANHPLQTLSGLPWPYDRACRSAPTAQFGAPGAQSSPSTSSVFAAEDLNRRRRSRPGGWRR